MFAGEFGSCDDVCEFPNVVIGGSVVPTGSPQVVNTTGKPPCRSLVGKLTEMALRVRTTPKDFHDPDNLACSLTRDSKTHAPELVFMQCPGSTKYDLATFHNILFVANSVDQGMYYGRLGGGTLFRINADDPNIRSSEGIAAKVC